MLVYFGSLFSCHKGLSATSDRQAPASPAAGRAELQRSGSDLSQPRTLTPVWRTRRTKPGTKQRFACRVVLQSQPQSETKTPACSPFSRGSSAERYANTALAFLSCRIGITGTRSVGKRGEAAAALTPACAVRRLRQPPVREAAGAGTHRQALCYQTISTFTTFIENRCNINISK